MFDWYWSSWSLKESKRLPSVYTGWVFALKKPAILTRKTSKANCKSGFLVEVDLNLVARLESKLNQLGGNAGVVDEPVELARLDY